MIIALGDVQLALHCTEPVVSLKRVGRVRERRRVTPQELGTPVAGLRRWRRWRLSVSLLKCLNSVVQGSHHLHLELEVLLRGQRRRHRDPSTLVVLPLVVLPLLVRTTLGVHHLIFWTKDSMGKDIAEINSDGYDIFLQERLRHDKVDRIE